MKFPLNVEKGMPFVKFYPMKYGFPAADLKDPKMKKTKWPGETELTLYVPGGFSESLSAAWDQQSLIGGSEADFGSKMGSVLSSLGKEAAGAKVASTISASKGVIAYPTELLVFSGVQPVNIDFSFELVPINEQESKNIYDICSKFKKLSLPKKSTNSVAGVTMATLDYPAVWDIRFSNVKGFGFMKENEYTDMALMSVNVSYSPGTSTMSTFQDGYAVVTKLDLKFQSIKRFESE